MSEVLRDSIPRSGVQYRVKRHSTERTVYNGNQVKEMAVATFDPSANTSERTIAAHGLGVYIPDNAVIIDAWYDVVTTFADGVADLATIALHVQSADDLVAAITVADASNVWDAGVHGTLVNNPNLGADAAHDTALEVIALYAATKVKMTAERELTATVAVVALTAGKLNLYVEYFISN